MSSPLHDISQISIYLQEDLAERVNEVALFQPLARKAAFDEQSKAIQERQWTFNGPLPLGKRLWRKLQSFVFQKLPFVVPGQRRTPEAKFKTALAILLSQETLREYFLGNPQRQASFLTALHQAAQSVGYTHFSSPSAASATQCARHLTTLAGNCLIEDPSLLSLQMATLSAEERNAVLFSILDRVERPPLTSVIEVTQGEEIAHNIVITTRYGKTHITQIEPQTGKLYYAAARDRATSSVRTFDNTRPGVKGAMNQRVASDGETIIGSYSGALLTKEHVLEQILFLLEASGECALLGESASAKEKIFVFTSLFSWNELDAIQAQCSAIEALHGKVLRIQGQDTKLHLLHRNLPFNALNKLPMPSETGAQIKDLNTLSLIYFTSWVLPHDPYIHGMIDNVEEARHEEDFLIGRRILLEQIDLFNASRQEWIHELEKQTTPAAKLLKALLSKKLRGIDELIVTSLFLKTLDIRETKNCDDSTDRSAGANAADKAQHAYTKIYGVPFIPFEASEEEIALFKVLYSMYLVWEEPELTAGLSTGFVGEKFYHNFLQRNPETTHYLVHWLKRHPEIYLGLSSYRR